jgi:hypothetical protein
MDLVNCEAHITQTKTLDSLLEEKMLELEFRDPNFDHTFLLQITNKEFEL